MTVDSRFPLPPLSPEKCLSILDDFRVKIQHLRSSGMPAIPNSEILRQLPPDWLEVIVKHVSEQYEDVMKEERQLENLQVYFIVILIAIEFICNKCIGVDMTGLTVRELQRPVKSQKEIADRLTWVVGSIFAKAFICPGLSPFDPARDCPGACRRPTFTD